MEAGGVAMKILELFSGYGTASFALKQLEIDYELVGYSDIDKYANQCFKQNHCPNDTEDKLRLGDCTKIDPNDLEDFDLLTGGFPCQAFSVAGKMLGELDIRGTLFNEIIRIAAAKKPRYMLLENVKGLLSKRHESTFKKILSELRRIGYHVHWKVLNTKEHGVPQNRERVFFVCFRDHDEWFNFQYPRKEELKIFLKDILEKDVDEKYYLSEDHIRRLIYSDDIKKGFSRLNPEIAGTQTARQYANWKGTFVVGNVNPSGKGMNGNVYGGDVSPTLITNKGEGPKIMQLNNPKHSNDRVYSQNGISPTLNTMQDGHRQPFIAIKNATKRGYLEGYPGDGVNLEHPDSKTRRGRIQRDVMGCLQTNDQRGVITEEFTIRKLTPRECFRLQGFLDDEINMKNISNSQLYKLAGNGQSVNVVKKIFSSLNLNKESSE